MTELVRLKGEPVVYDTPEYLDALDQIGEDLGLSSEILQNLCEN